MSRPHALAVAVATCAAAGVHGAAAAADESASLQAVAELGRHAMLDARAALIIAGESSWSAQRLLARSARRLGYAHTMAARLRADHDASAAAAAAAFSEESSALARYTGALARRSDGHTQALAVRGLRRAARLQSSAVAALAASAGAAPSELRTALQAQRDLLRSLEAALVAERVPDRRCAGVRAARTGAGAARDALIAALATATTRVPA
jgi:hypothetical protein